MKYVIERQYLLPIYQHLVIEAGSAEEACRKAVEHDDWEDAKEDGDGARETTITALRPVPDGQEPDNLGDFLYGDKPEEATRAVPAAFAENPIPPLGKRCKDALVIVNPGACNPRASHWRSPRPAARSANTRPISRLGTTLPCG
jgi:hypothetical protein